MHRFDESADALSRAIVAYARNRIASPQPLDGPATGGELRARAGATVTAEGLGGDEALRIWSEVLAPATISTDHPSSMAFVPSAPTKASVLFDLIVGASSTIAAGWIDGAGAIWAENEALRWVADLAGFPPEAGGVFVSGGSAGNLSALVAARYAAAGERERPATGWKVAVADSVHSSVVTAARVMDVGVVRVPGDEHGRLTGAALEEALIGRRRRRVRRGGERRLHERRHGRRAGGRRRRVRRARCVAPRGRRVRRRGTGGPFDPSPFRRHRARRLVHRGSPQVAVRARTTAAPCSTATRRGRAARSVRRPSTWTP